MNTGNLIEVRTSTIHGCGVFALRPIAQGTRIIEYAGERLSSAQIDARYAGEDECDRGRTFIIQLDTDCYIDGAHRGNAARFINHSCEPNCEGVAENERIFIYALADIQPGQELTYDYSLELEEEPLSDWREIYSCRCGAARCRGSMLGAI